MSAGALAELAVGFGVLLAALGYGGWALVQVRKWQHEMKERRELVKAARRWEGQ